MLKRAKQAVFIGDFVIDAHVALIAGIRLHRDWSDSCWPRRMSETDPGTLGTGINAISLSEAGSKRGRGI